MSEVPTQFTSGAALGTLAGLFAGVALTAAVLVVAAPSEVDACAVVKAHILELRDQYPAITTEPAHIAELSYSAGARLRADCSYNEAAEFEALVVYPWLEREMELQELPPEYDP